MHVAEMEAESRRIKLFTESKFKEKSIYYEQSLKAIKNEAS